METLIARCSRTTSAAVPRSRRIQKTNPGIYPESTWLMNRPGAGSRASMRHQAGVSPHFFNR